MKLSDQAAMDHIKRGGVLRWGVDGMMSGSTVRLSHAEVIREYDSVRVSFLPSDLTSDYWQIIPTEEEGNNL